MYLSIIFSTIFSVFNFFGEKGSPVTWTFETKEVDDHNIELIATASIQKTWVLYSQFTDDNGPIPTSFVVNNIEMKFDEKSKAIKEFDSMFDVEVIKFKEIAVFTKTFPIKKGDSLSGYVTYMTCDGEKCLPPTDVNFDLKY